MSERTPRLASAILAAAGAAISTYLLYVRQTGGTLVCSTGGCETVQSSSYAEMLGVPVAALGLAGFLALLVLALARGEWGPAEPGHARARGVLLRRLPALRPGERARRDLPVVPRDRRDHDRDRRPGAPAPSSGRAAGACSRAGAAVSEAPADRQPQVEAASADALTGTPDIRSLDDADESREFDAAAGQVYLIPPGHDAWVVGNEPCVALDLRAS